MGIVKDGSPSWKGPPLHADGEPPDNDGMEARVAALEKDMKDVRERVIKIEAKIDNLPSMFASKSDLAEAKTSIILWVVSAVFLVQFIPGFLRKLGLM